MSRRRSERTQACSDADAETRLRNARKFLEVAELLAGESRDVEYSSQAASLAVLAGIAASDAACCRSLGRRSRGQDHRAAAELLAEVTPGGPEAARSLRRLLTLKDSAHYGLLDMSGQDLKAALRQARELIVFAERVMQG